MESEFRRVFDGPRWRLLFGSLTGVEREAVIVLQQLLQYYLPYTLEVAPAGPGLPGEGHVAVIGVRGEHPVIDALIRDGLLPDPAAPEGFSLALLRNVQPSGGLLLVVAGADPRGALYGAHEAAARLFCGGTLLDGRAGAGRRAALDNAEPFCVSEHPAVAERGLWTWGYPITDYRGFFARMARLKMNMVTVWNDTPPLNVSAFIDEAHRFGIRVILGFHWGWGHTGSLDLSREADRAAIRESVLATYRRDYAGLSHDGIYFQTLTEHRNERLAGRSTAWWAALLVNDTARSLLDEWPGLPIRFGLHATSIGENYRDLAALDPRVTIVWEDCFGQIPWTYHPAQAVEPTGDFDAMLAYARRIATFRSGSAFALVPKGWTCIRWQQDFENHGSFLIGERSALETRERLALRANDWDRIDAHWLEHFPCAARFYREMLVVNPSLSACALVEDGLFEAAIAPSVALLAETLWNPFRPDTETLRRALRPYYSRW